MTMTCGGMGAAAVIVIVVVIAAGWAVIERPWEKEDEPDTEPQGFPDINWPDVEPPEGNDTSGPPSSPGGTTPSEPGEPEPTEPEVPDFIPTQPKRVWTTLFYAAFDNNIGTVSIWQDAQRVLEENATCEQVNLVALVDLAETGDTFLVVIEEGGSTIYPPSVVDPSWGVRSVMYCVFMTG